jgi:hypothetical protein
MNKDSICVLPWIHLATHPIGTVTPCCITDMTNSISTASHPNGNHLFLGKDKLEDITNSDKFNEVRRQMINGEKPAICQKCYKYEDGGVESKRIESNKKFEEFIDQCFQNTNEDGSLKNVNYNYVELRLGTVCNLKCVTCNPFSSNRWNEDVSQFKGTKFENDYFKCDIRTEWYRDHSFYDELYTKCNNLKEIWVNGGEPTLIKEHGYFLEKFITDGTCENINLHYSINMTRLPDKFIEIWKKFNKVRIHISIDDLEERNDYIRYGGKWDDVIQNFNKILQYKDIFNLEVCQTVSAYNVYNIDNFKKFTLDNDVVISHNYVHYPSFQHVSLIPEEMKNQILSNIQYMREDEVERLKIELFKDNNKENDFIDFVKILDKTRNLKITDYLPEWVPYIK